MNTWLCCVSGGECRGYRRGGTGGLPRNKIENKGVIWCILGCLQGLFYVIMNMILLPRNLLLIFFNWKKKKTNPSDKKFNEFNDKKILKMKSSYDHHHYQCQNHQSDLNT